MRRVPSSAPCCYCIVLQEDEALDALRIICEALTAVTLARLNLSDNALGEKGVRACATAITSQVGTEKGRARGGMPLLCHVMSCGHHRLPASLLPLPIGRSGVPVPAERGMLHQCLQGSGGAVPGDAS